MDLCIVSSTVFFLLFFTVLEPPANSLWDISSDGGTGPVSGGATAASSGREERLNGVVGAKILQCGSKSRKIGLDEGRKIWKF